MGLPYALTSFTSPIVNTALKTGGRGETTTLTDYGVIGDAFFKKAQLDLGIAELKGSMAMKSAELQSNLEMDKARINTSMLQSRMDYDVNLRQLKMELEKDEASVFESVMTGLAGAAMAASIPLTMGASTPVVIGAAAGGGLLAGMSSAKGGRQAGQSSLNMLNSASVLATSFKSAQGEKINKDTLNTVLTEGSKWAGIINNPGASAGERQNAQQQLNQLMANQANAQIQKGVNPEIAYNSVNGMGQILMGGGNGGSSSRARGGFDANEAWEVRNDAIFNKALTSGQLDDPKTAGQAREKLMNDLRVNYAEQFTKQGDPESGLIPNQLLHSLVEKSGINEKPGLMAIDTAATPSRASDGGPITQTPQLRKRRGASSAGRGPTGAIANPQEGPSVRQDTPSFSNPIPQQSVRSAPPMLRKGLEMDDGQPPITSPQAVEPLTRIGEKSAETIRELEEQKNLNEQKYRSDDSVLGKIKRDAVRIKDKIVGGSPLGVLKSDHAKRQDKLDDQIDRLKDEQEKDKEHAQNVRTERAVATQEDLIFEQRQRREIERRAAANPGVIEQRKKERQELEAVAPKIEDLSEEDVARRNRKQGLRDAVTSAQHLDDVMEKIPDDLWTRFTEFVESEGLGVKSPHLDLKTLDEIGDALSDKTAQSKFTAKERDLLNEYRLELFNLAYADAMMDSSRDVRMEHIQISKKNMPNFGDDYRERSTKLRLLMRGYKERIIEGTRGGNKTKQKEDLELENKRLEGVSKRLEIQKKRNDLQEEESLDTLPTEWTVLKRRYGHGGRGK